MVCGATCEWKASECGAQRGAARHANGKRQNAVDNGARHIMRMESASARCTTKRGAQWCVAQHANGKRQSAAHNGVRRGNEWQASGRGGQQCVAQHANEASECGAQRSAARHVNGKRQSAAHNGVRRNMRMESARARRTTECGAACEWKASERGAQWSAARQCEWQASECGAQRSAARHANGKRQNAAQTECSAVTTQRKLRPSVHFRRRVRAQAKRRAGGRRLARPYRRGVALRLYCRFGPERPPL